MKRKVGLGIAAAVLAILVLVPLGVYLWLRTSLPVTQGSLRAPGLDGAVQITRDRYGIPHIFATTDHDAFFGLGYVHAQDRLWQMEMNRRIGAGRLSEVLGEATLDIDKFQRTMGYYRLVQEDMASLSERSRGALTAYAAGVNAWLAEGHTLPPEFLLLGVKPEAWTPADSLVWSKMMSWDLGGDYDMELLRSQLVQAIGPERTAQLLPSYPKSGIDILTGTEIYPGTASKLFAIDRALQSQFSRRGREAGSNDWVIAGGRTATGKPMLADDPHLAASEPSIWYLAELQGDQIHAIGATFPGLPAIVIGHNDRVAWGVTNVNPDVQDLYIEHINPANPNQVEVDGQWRDLAVADETIQVKGKKEPVHWAARSTRHGPLISDVSSTASPVALRWTALDRGDTTMDAFFGLNYAHDWNDFVAAQRLFITPSQNFVYGDVDGNIGYYAPGHIPLRPQGDNGMLPVPGWQSTHEWQGWIPFDQLPHAYNPAKAYIATANNRVVDDQYPYLLSNDWAPPYRAQRIVQLIEQMSSGDKKITVDDMATIQGDQSSAQVPELLPFLRSVSPKDDRQQKAINLLQNWDGRLGAESTPAAIYEVWMVELEHAIFDDDLHGDLYHELATRANPTFLANILHDPQLGAAWCDDVLTPVKEDCAQIAQVALDKALEDLDKRLGQDMNGWQWGKLHQIQYPHRPFSQVPYLKWIFHRSIPNGGDRYTVNAAPPDLDTLYDQTHSPSLRQIVDLADLNNSRFIITTGESGNVLSSHYDDFIRMHRDVQYVPMTFGKQNTSGDTLTLQP